MPADSIRFSQGKSKRILIDDDPNRVLVFNPDDNVFAEKFYAMLAAFEDKQKDFESRASEMEAKEKTQDITQDGIVFVRDVCLFVHGQIDDVFGPGSAQIIFGGVQNIFMIGEFFEQIKPIIESSRRRHIDKYLPPTKKRARR